MKVDPAAAMKPDPARVATGEHFLDGNHACGEGALAAGCMFFAGYPITPSTEIAERCAMRFGQVGGVFIQMEDELASMNAILGGSWAGLKTMTCTSGPGFSLMMENFGLGMMLETPTVLVNVQRGGPSTGLPTLSGQADMMQCRFGSHGDYQPVALSPDSPQECFYLVIDAFNISERLRMPVFVMTDECVGHMTEKVVIPKADEIDLYPRRFTDRGTEGYLPYAVGEDLIPHCPPVGKGYKFHITGLTHDERGYPVISPEAQAKYVTRLSEKVMKHADELIKLEEDQTEGADVVLVSYGITSRVARPAIDRARKEGIKVGLLRLITVWPFCEKRINQLIKSGVKGFCMAELNQGQVYLELDRVVRGRTKVSLAGHPGGGVHDPDDIYKKIKEVAG